MKYLKTLLAFLLLAILFVSGCSPKDTKSQTNNSKLQEMSERNIVIEDFKKKYSAVELDNKNRNVTFSAEIVDNYKEKNIYSQIVYIDDVFYSDEDLLMYADSYGNAKLLLKITRDQYSVIQSLHNNNIDFGLHCVFTLDNLEPMLPTLRADFNFDISTGDDIFADYDTSVFFNSQIIHGTLVDIIEVQGGGITW